MLELARLLLYICGVLAGSKRQRTKHTVIPKHTAIQTTMQMVLERSEIRLYDGHTLSSFLIYQVRLTGGSQIRRFRPILHSVVLFYWAALFDSNNS